MASAPKPLPIDPELAGIASTLDAHGALVLIAPPGTGKTTRVPGALIDRGQTGTVVVLEPRRVAARAAARRVALERGGRVGDEVGYAVRGECALSARTRIAFVTEGVLVRRLVADPFLEGVGAVVLDEFHERHLEGDLALAMLQEIRATVRPDLRVAVMSATLVPEGPAAFLGGCPVLEVASPLHAVRTVHEPDADRRPLERRVAAAVRRALDETAGDVLVFLPGVGEIAAARSALAGLPDDVEVSALHGRQPPAEQDRALAAGERRKVVLSTNLAESSLTVEGVTAVVDAGLARILRHDPGRGLDTLRVERISVASADQRRGRAGRTGPGVCYRLWTAGEERGMVASTAPEIRRVDVAGAVLLVRGFGGRPDSFGWFEAPRAAALAEADSLLRALGALERGGERLTAVGREMLRFPLHPRLARMMVAAARAGRARDGALLAALLTERDVFRAASPPPPADLLEVAGLVRDLERHRLDPGAAGAAGMDPAAVRAVLRARDRAVPRRSEQRAAGGDEELVKAVLAGFPDRVARRQHAGSTRAVLVGGGGLRLSEEAAAAAGDLFLALQTLQTGRRERAEARVVRLVPLERRWLDEVFPERVAVVTEAELDAPRARVVAVRRVRFGDLVLEEARGGEPDPADAARLLGGLLAQDPWRHIRDADELRDFVARVEWLRRSAPELDLPDLGAAAVAAAAASLCAGRASLDGLRGADVASALGSGLPPHARAALEQRAPARIALPSGRRARVEYAAPAGPTVAAPMQELFGLPRTPTLGPAGPPVVLELLAPNRRPIQVTRDLASFWATVYPKVRSELRRRYPRHAWPEDPLGSRPERAPRRRLS